MAANYSPNAQAYPTQPAFVQSPQHFQQSQNPQQALYSPHSSPSQTSPQVYAPPPYNPQQQVYQGVSPNYPQQVYNPQMQQVTQSPQNPQQMPPQQAPPQQAPPQQAPLQQAPPQQLLSPHQQHQFSPQQHPQHPISPGPQPAKAFVGHFSQFVHPQPVSLTIKEHKMSLSGDSFTITQNGAPVIRIEGKVLTLHGRKVVTDASGNHLFDIIKEPFHLHTTYVAETSMGHRLMEVKFHFTFLSYKATITIFNNGQPDVYLLEGNWRASRASIVNQTTLAPIAHIIRERNASHYLLDVQTYQVEVMPNVDAAIVAAMCVCMDEKKEAGK